MPNRASGRSRADTQPLASLRHRLVGAAVSLADREGLEAVSIRRIAAELGLRPMSIYTYIASKEELLDLMAETVVAEVLVKQSLPEDWRAAVETIALQSHQVFLAHPWLAAISQQRPDLGRNAVHHAEQLLAAIAPLDLSPEDAWQALFLINDFTLGHAIRVGHAPTLEAGTYPPFDAEHFPHLARTLPSARRRDINTFLAGLRLLLDGLSNASPAAASRARRSLEASRMASASLESGHRAKQEAQKAD